MEELHGCRVVSITLGRDRRLKGGRVVTKEYRQVWCNIGLLLDADGYFKQVYRSKGLDVRIQGRLKDDVFIMKSIELLKVKQPYLRKFYKRVLGYNLTANITNVG